jgi:hypothetical protein
MSNILIGYEYGLGMGHLARLLPIARALSDRNHKVVFFLRNPHECTKIITKEKLPIIPVMNIRANIPELRMQTRYNSYSDFIAIAGCYDLEHLFTVTLSWKTIFDIYKPDLIICDHSPICCLSAFGKIPVVLIGDGFTLPPAHEPVFPVVSGASSIVDPDRLLDNMRIVQKMHGQKIPQTITEPFRTAARLFCTLPELDHYTLLRRDTIIGPPPNDLFEPIESPSEPLWFAYLKAEFPITGKIIESLCDVKIPGEVYINGLTPEGAEQLIRNNITVHNEPPPMRDMLPRVSVVLHHGGNGIACAALSAGRPQIVFPMYQEAELTGGFLRRMGAGHVVYPKDVQSMDVSALIDETAENSAMMERSQTVARNIHERGQYRFLETCIETCEKILAG